LASLARHPEGDSVALAKCSGMVGKANAGSKDALKKINKRASKKLQNKK
jgi:hypothetical protein